MGIYNTEGDLDLVEAAAELNAQTTVTNRPAAEFVLGKIEAAALLDIAGSLRTLALEASFRMQSAGYIEVDLSAEEDVEFDELPDVRPEDAPAGSRVRLRGGTGEPDDFGTLTGESGVSEGEAWVRVKWDGDTGPHKTWVRDLEVMNLPGAIVELADGTVLGDGITPPTLTDIRESDTPLVGVATEAESPALRTDADEDDDEAVSGYELDEPANTTADPDDLDDDFDGDEHPAALDALAALKAREKAAKAAKAKKGKKP